MLVRINVYGQKITLEDHWWQANNTIRTIVKDTANNLVYVGGDFSSFGPSEPFGALLDSGSATIDFNYANPNGVVYASISDGVGGWFIGGEFTMVGDSDRNCLAHINSIGEVTAWNPHPDTTVRALVLSGGQLFVGGDFTTIGGELRNRIAELDPSTGLATSWNPNANSNVFSIAASGGSIYVGGGFTSIGGQTRLFIAALDRSTGLATTWDPSSNSYVYSVIVSGGVAYAGGNFSSIGGQTRNYVAAIDIITGVATSWNPNASATVLTLATSGTNVYVGGYFNTIGGQSRSRIAEIDSTSGLATSWDANATSTGTVHSIMVAGPILYVGGDFQTIGGSTRKYAAALNISSGVATAWDLRANNRINSFAISSGKVYIGGRFTSLGGEDRNHIAALDATTGIPTNWKPDADNVVYSLAVSGDTVYAGGNFTNIGGESRNRIASLDASTGSATSWNPNSNAIISCVIVSQGKVYVGGSFTAIGGQTRNRIAALDETTGLATAWNPISNSTVRTLFASGNTLYVGGNFSNIGGQVRNKLAALDISSGLATSWDPSPSNTVRTISKLDQTVYVGGEFVTIGGQSRNFIAAVDSTTGLATGWNPNANTSVYSLSISEDLVYLGGLFTTVGGQSRNRIAAVDINSGLINSWNPDAGIGYVYAILESKDEVYVGGNFGFIGSQLRDDFAVFSICNLSYGTIDLTTCLNYTSPSAKFIWDSSDTYVDTLVGVSACGGDSIITVNLVIASPSITAQKDKDVTCNNNNNGQISIITSLGGTGTLSYSINNGVFGSNTNFSSLGAGNYTIYVKDSLNCVDSSLAITIVNPAALDVTAQKDNDINCHNDNDGQISVTTSSGGTGTLSYSINNGAFGSNTSFNSLVEGDYTIYVKDSLNCVDSSLSITVVNPAAVNVTGQKDQDITCNNDNDGQISAATSSGGTGVLSYSINNGVFGSNTTFSSLGAGDYTIYVKDSLNCADSSMSITIINPDSIELTASGIDESIAGDDGVINSSAIGGTGALEYSIDGTTFQNIGDFTGLQEGAYLLTVQDENGCKKTTSINLGSLVGLNVGLIGEFSVFPNPSHGLINITMSKSSFDVIVYNEIGEEIRNVSPFKKQFQLELEAGVYFIKVRTVGGQMTKKIVISK